MIAGDFDAVLGAIQSVLPAAANASTLSGGQAMQTEPVGAQFGQMVSEGLQGVNQQLLVAQTDLQQLATGDAQNLHQVMIRLEESRLSFQLLMQVRNRLLDSYQDIMKMTV